MTETDKEKIKEALGILEKNIEYYEGTEKEFFATKQYSQASYFGTMARHLKEIKEILEK